jgi:hypothetical protein
VRVYVHVGLLACSDIRWTYGIHEASGPSVHDGVCEGYEAGLVVLTELQGED